MQEIQKDFEKEIQIQKDLEKAINTINQIIDNDKYKCFTCLYGKKQDIVKGLFIKYDNDLDSRIIAIDI